MILRNEIAICHWSWQIPFFLHPNYHIAHSRVRIYMLPGAGAHKSPFLFHSPGNPVQAGSFNRNGKEKERKKGKRDVTMKGHWLERRIFRRSWLDLCSYGKDKTDIRLVRVFFFVKGGYRYGDHMPVCYWGKFVCLLSCHLRRSVEKPNWNASVMSFCRCLLFEQICKMRFCTGGGVLQRHSSNKLVHKCYFEVFETK